MLFIYNENEKLELFENYFMNIDVGFKIYKWL